ncbi:helix-turn-helix domain-containing protein [Kitasatospora sp. NPDC093558]|uniref:helix-turn-helix domain-containing protein n=1 Tax=Kitasatospora sp. NPDC093558 TaxID=3155201 RepID=UPI003421CEFA
MYETLRTEGAIGRDELQSALAVSSKSLGLALDELSDLRMVKESSPGDGIVALPASAALRQLLVEQREQLKDYSRQLLHRVDAVERLLADYTFLPAGEQAELRMTVITERAEIGRFFDDLAELTTSTVESMHPGPLPDAEQLAASLDRDRRLLDRGVTLRSLYPASFFAATRLRRYFQSAVEIGTELRLCAHVPTDLLIVDRELVLLPLDPANPGSGICVLRGGPLVQAGLAFFEHCWHQAHLLDAEHQGPVVNGPGEQQTALLRLLADGVKDDRIARVLGISPRTLSRLISELLVDLQAKSRFEAGVKAVQLGWLAP